MELSGVREGHLFYFLWDPTGGPPLSQSPPPPHPRPLAGVGGGARGDDILVTRICEITKYIACNALPRGEVEVGWRRR